jgi:hypothetical protein
MRLSSRRLQQLTRLCQGVKNLLAQFQHPLLMVRADAHTVWRGHSLDDGSAQALVATLCGRGSFIPA